MQRHDYHPQQRHDRGPERINEVSILALLNRFTFSILPCGLEEAREAVRVHCARARKVLVVDETRYRDVRMIYFSDDGPDHLPITNLAIMMTTVDGSDGKRTLLVNSVSDGFLSLIYSMSNTIRGIHLMVSVSRLDLKFPRNSILAVANGDLVRTVYAMRDSGAWVFFEKGDPLPFEDADNYRARRKKDRLTPEIISACLTRIGYGSLRQEFWVDQTARAHVMATRDFRFWHPDQEPSNGR